MTLTIEKRYNGSGEEIDESYQPVIPELVNLLTEVYQKINTNPQENAPIFQHDICKNYILKYDANML